MKHYDVIFFKTSSGKEPLNDWLCSIKDPKTRARIKARFYRLEEGNFGDCEPVGDGVYELRMFFGKGYRVYYAIEKNKLVILLSGGDKSAQTSDIKKAKQYLKEYKEQKND